MSFRLLALAGFFISMSCTHVLKREPAGVCDLTSETALKNAKQYLEINAYLRGPFTERLRNHMSVNGNVRSCKNDDLSSRYLADVQYAQEYVKQVLVQANAKGAEMLDMRLVESLDCLKSVAKEVRPSLEQVKSETVETSYRLLKLKSEFEEYRKSRAQGSCSAASEWSGKNKIAASVLRTNIEMSGGSAFVAGTARQKYLITAAHVSRLSLEPSEVHLGLDLTMKPTELKVPALKVAASSQIPGKQKFFAVGYPAKDSGNLKAIECFFEGFVKSARGTDAQYLFYCPGRGQAKSISGGPMVDESGKVWGVNSQQAAYSGAFFVTPLSSDAKGEIRIGVQNIFLSDACYDRNLLASRRCQIMPNTFESQVP